MENFKLISNNEIRLKEVVSIIYIKNSIIQELKSFIIPIPTNLPNHQVEKTQYERYNIIVEAENFFIDNIKKLSNIHNIEITEEEIEVAIDQGYYEINIDSLWLIWSN